MPRRLALVLALALAAGCDAGGASPTAAEPTAAPTASPEASGAGPSPGGTTGEVVPTGFRAVLATVVVDGEERSLCLLLAATPEERAQGLMGVTSLGGHDGMVFVWDTPTDTRFWMRDTVLPLSVAFFDDAGAFVSARDMDPCPPGAECPLYGADAPFRMAVEVPQGDLPEHDLVPGATLVLTDQPCTPAGEQGA